METPPYALSMYVCLFVCMHLRLSVCICVCLYAFVYVCMHVRMCVCMRSGGGSLLNQVGLFY